MKASNHTDKLFLFILCLIFNLYSFAGTITGTVTDDKGQPLPFASITVKGTQKGAIANAQGKYSVGVDAGLYVILCQHVGYKPAQKNTQVTDKDVVVDFVLSVQDLKMEEVVIKRGEDPALEIMRQAIRKRDFYNKQTDSLTVDVYIKGLIRSRQIPERILGSRIDRSEFGKQGLDSSGKGILFLSESLTKVSFRQPDKIKMEVVSSRQSGGGFGLSFPFFVNFYTPNVQLFSGNITPRGFVSPLADAAFHYYKFRFEGSFFEEGKMVDRIRVMPRRQNEPLFDGWLQIVDGEWRIHSLNLLTTKSTGLDILDTLRVTQMHIRVEKDVYKTGNQVVYFAAKIFGFSMTGDFLNVYTAYNLNPGFRKGSFNRILMKYDTAATKRDSSYWAGLRPVPLDADERRNFVFKDSVSKTERAGANPDSLRRAQKPLNFSGFLRGGVTRRFYSKRGQSTYRFEALFPQGIEYNTVEGLALIAAQSLTIRPRNGKHDFRLESITRYGFSNTHFNAYGSLQMSRRSEGPGQRWWRITGGKRLLQFNHDNPVDPQVNTLYTLLRKRNYAKYYEAWTGGLEVTTRSESGLRMAGSFLYENRMPLLNSTDFSFLKRDRVYLPNHPFELAGVPFNRHTAVVASVNVSFQPGQRYIQFPTFKQAIGSNYPTIELQYQKGLPDVFKSTADFDKWKASVHDDLPLRLLGTLRYRVGAGGFFSRKQVNIPDYTHFIGNQTFNNSHYLNSFQLAPYYRYSNTESLYGVAHVEHHFNGLLTNKIPLFNKLKWNLVAGTNTLYVNRFNYYTELFVGLENLLKIFRLDFVTAVQAAPGNRFGLRLGLGGVIGGAVQPRRND